MRVAAIDCGTNSIRLLIADHHADGGSSSLTDVVREMQVVRLGEGVDRTGGLSAAAIERTRAALAGYVHLIHAHRATHIRMVATSASRDASNASEFTDMVLEVLGQLPEVISGDEEAALSFAGAVRGLRGDIVLPTMVVDIGGGSTEFVVGADVVEAALSVDIGCVRMTERHLVSDPPTLGQIDAAVLDIDDAIARAADVVPFERARSLVGVAGSVTTVAAIALELPAYDPQAIHGSRISAAQIGGVTARLLGMTRAERSELPVMHPGRIDVIGGGALVLSRIMESVGATEVVVSETDILDGIAWSIAE